tara:strand:+ start:458 stop:667 length:210 start_codon:yes stop_codon:yes gene_type:complete
MDKNLIIHNFFNLNEELIESPFKEKLIDLRKNFEIEIGGPGCTPCKMNAAKKKYTQIINGIFPDDELIN